MINIDARPEHRTLRQAGGGGHIREDLRALPLAAWCTSTRRITGQSQAILLRSGNAGSNTVAGHITVLTEALRAEFLKDALVALDIAESLSDGARMPSDNRLDGLYRLDGTQRP
ncbi:hypothetical protein E1281_38625 [Actinomadura sp. KC345]|uniref:hypothetical protein n=1 Tax=Actinomadura sp. KC345 TaxID=2530371 RepID=UPI0010F37069|nr:hypothetical protein [Actinomadura sp. KC345]TDC39676.1 hypothetical protein E1281_38625 [Actinomadura sp. KC345]